MSYAVAMECALPMPLVSTEWLANNIDAAPLRIIDASWYLPAEQRDSAAEFAQQHVPGAVFFDIERICDRRSELPHMAPDADAFAAAVSRLGINSDDRIVVYDTAGLFSAARVWWLFRLMGSASVAVLDGGLPKWLAEGRPTDAGDMPIPSARFDAVMRSQHVCDRHAVAAALRTGSAQVVDARPAARFAGLAPEPRAGLSSGHMPGAIYRISLQLCWHIDRRRAVKGAVSLTWSRGLVFSAHGAVNDNT
mgnify:CR=1 FL=1